jgi:hypothetical protein
MLEDYTFVDWIKAFVHQYPTNIGEDTSIIGSINGSKFHHVIMFVITRLITPQLTVHFTMKFRR